jgi:hypothetical protein
MSKLNRTTAAVFLAGAWLTSPLAVGVAAADRSANESASDSADSDGSGGATPRAAQREAAPPVRGGADSGTSESEPVVAIDPPETHFVEIDQPLLPAVELPESAGPEVRVHIDPMPDPLPEPSEVAALLSEAGNGVADGADIDPPVPADSGETVEEALPGEAVEEALPGEAAEEALPGEAVEGALPEPDPKAEAPTEEHQSVDVAGGRGGGVTPLPFWRSGVGDPPTEGDLEPVALESTGVDSGGAVPDPLSPDIDTDQPVYYFDGTTDSADLPMLATGGDSPQTGAGSGSLVEMVAKGVNQILDAVSVWISGLPAGPLQDLLAGVLLLVRNALPQEWVKPARLSSGQLIDGDDGNGESDADSGESDSVGEDSDTGDADSDDSDRDDLLEGLTGLGESDAQVAAGVRGLIVRVVARDGEYFAVTKDYRTDRVNFEIVQGVVVKVSIG